MNIQKEIKRIIKKEYTKKNEIISLDIDEKTNLITVLMPSTCEPNATMEWKFLFDYEEGNEDCFTEYEKSKYAELIEKPKLTIKSID